MREFTAHGHHVLVETRPAPASAARTTIIAPPAPRSQSCPQPFAQADLIVKVKEPQAVERRMLRPNQILFTYLHLAPDPDQTGSGRQRRDLHRLRNRDRRPRRATVVAPMSQVAGRLSIQAGAAALERAKGGRSILLGGVPGVAPAKGGGDRRRRGRRKRHLHGAGHGRRRDRAGSQRGGAGAAARRFGTALKTALHQAALEDYVPQADLVVGGVLAGAEAPSW